MTGNNRTLKNKLIYFTGSLILLCVFVFILQYNNYYYTQKYLEIQEQTGQLKNIPGKMDIAYQQFLKSEILTEQFYTSGKSLHIDSINQLITQFIQILDSIHYNPFLHADNNFESKILGLINDSKLFKRNLKVFQNLLLDRGFYTSGKSGEWHRFGLYLEDLAQTYGNASTLKSIAQLNQIKNMYQFQKKPEHLSQLRDNINLLKTNISSNKESFTNGIKADEQLKLIKELDNFAALTAEIQKNDIKSGILGSGGVQSEISLNLSTIQTKSDNLYTSYNQLIKEKIAEELFIKMLIIIIIGLLFYWFIRAFLLEIIYTISEIKRYAGELVQGKIPKSLQLQDYSETIEISLLYNNYAESLRDKIKFAANLGAGKTNIALNPLSSEDVLSNALLDMEKSLHKAEEEDRKYKEEEQKRAWANEGHAKFGEILRMQTDNLTTLSDEIILHIVKYLNANQGNIFLYNDDNQTDIHLELISSFAYDRKKYLKKRIEIGEGLVGTCAQEKQTIFLTEIPENYIEITSGLGDASPRSLLLVPLKTEKNIFGILEIASFNIFRKHEIEFVEKLAQSIASTFATVKINIHTAKLLEQSKRQAEEMAQQEEEMRQNFEELQATQEESARKEAEITSLVQAVDASALVLQTDMEGRIIEVNKKFSTTVNLHRDELLGKYLKHVFTYNTDSDEFYNHIRELKLGQKVTRIEEIRKEGDIHLFFEVHYSPILDRDGRPYKILCIAINLTQSKNLESQLKQKEQHLKEIDSQYKNYSAIIDLGFIHCNLAPDTTILEVNKNYIEITGYSREELIGASYRKFLKADELKQFEMIWPEVLKDKIYKGVIKRTTPTGEEHWLMASLIPSSDENGTLSKIILLAQDITEKKLKYQVLEEANKEIERLKGLQNQA